MSLTITKGPRKTAVRAVVYGVEGIGKTSLAALLPAPLFLDLEEGTHQLDVARASVDTITGLVASLAHLASDAQGFQTIVIDSADWAERLAAEALLKKQNKKSIEDFGFGKGFVMLAEEMARTLAACDTLIHRGLHVVWIAHAKTVRVSPPDMVDGFDRYELKMAKQTAPLFKEWADLLLFANYETTLIKGNDGRVKGDGGKRRLLFAERSAAWDAKNRYGLPEQLSLEHGILAPELAAVFGGKVQARAVAQAAPAENASGLFHEVQIDPPVTADQLAKLTTYGKTAIGAKVIDAALEHYRAMGADELTEEQARRVIERCQEEFNKVAPAKGTPPAGSGTIFPWPAPFAAWLTANEDAVNKFLVSKSWIQSGQTWRDLPGERAETIIEREVSFAKSAGIAVREGGK
jgi:hypothetical protein